MSTVTVFVPKDAAAISVGADDVAAALSQEAQNRGIDINLIRNGSRGLLWLEPLVEVETPSGRVAFGPVARGDIVSLFDADFLSAGDHVLGHGLTEDIPYLANQERLTFARCGVADPLDLGAYETQGGLVGLKKALELESTAITEEVTLSGLRGRGGAGFPAGIKWETVRKEVAEQKYICCNADEGDSGTFADRMLIVEIPLCCLRAW